jgi:ABC-type Fe3+-hydroxamate transport system substrate-binding protein
MPYFRDQLNNSILLDQKPKRIVCLVPSLTELLIDLGLKKELIGKTKFCIHPKNELKDVKIVGGTKNVNIQRVIDLNPDLIIANKEENSQNEIEILQKLFATFVTDINNLSDSIEAIKLIGEMNHVDKKAESIINDIQQIENQIKEKSIQTKLNVLYLIWRKPYIAVGKQTYINSILELCRFKNYINENRYPEITLENLEDIDCIFLSSEPYPFNQQHINQLKSLDIKSKIILIDGEVFSWYGTRMIHKKKYLLKLINQLKTTI